MRLGLLSDIHSNLPALEATLAFLRREGVDRLVALGDIIGYGAHPRECLALVRERVSGAILGNHDAGAIGRLPLTSFTHLARQALLWTMEQLSPEDRAYLEGLPLVVETPESLLVHATPADPESWDYLVHREDARRAFAHFTQPLAFIGHTHRPLVFVLPPTPEEIYLHGPYELYPKAGYRYLVNVGSVGQPRDNDPRATSVIWDQEEGTIQFCRVEYDVQAAQEAILARALPPELARRLAWGV